jgi:murein DD-endopeptidase MepM/ murein hydrolase activator NlpD
VDIAHAGGVVTRYCHMLTHPYVHEGQAVAVGQVVGIVGSSGHSSGPHLHFEVHVSGTPTDPIPFMTSMRAALGT